jgi:hypothetical protein
LASTVRAALVREKCSLAFETDLQDVNTLEMEDFDSISLDSVDKCLEIATLCLAVSVTLGFLSIDCLKKFLSPH